MRKIKITHDGQPCRKCGTPVVFRSHNGPSGPGQTYWFKYWFYCPGCSTAYMVEKAKVVIAMEDIGTEDAHREIDDDANADTSEDEWDLG